jgi:3D (Asp-Asp-Asp) domain-containing protein
MSFSAWILFLADEAIMRMQTWLATLLVAALAACGGSTRIGVSAFSGGFTFIIWEGNGNLDRVVDVNNQAFAFNAKNGCLFNFRSGRENPLFCVVAADDTVFYNGSRIRLANIRSSTGACVTALIDDATGRFLDIRIDAFGTEIVFVTTVRPFFCLT